MIPLLHAVTDDRILALDDFTARAAAALSAGGAELALHLRGPRTGGGRLHSLGRGLREAAGREGALLVVNDRIDVALALGVPAVQLGRRSLPPAEARRILGAAAVVGMSVHDPDEARWAAAEGADWLIVGSVYETPSHPEACPAGPGIVASSAAFGPPVVAIGGITPERVPELRETGAVGVAAIRAIWDAPSVPAAVGAFLRALRTSP